MSVFKMAEAAIVRKGVAALQDELEKTRDRLRGVDETIKKLTGRDPSENRHGQRRIVRAPDIRGVELGRGRERMFALARYGTDNHRGPPAKRPAIQSAFGRLGPQIGFNRPGPRRDRDSGDEDDLPRKVTLHSSVVVTPKETRTRNDTMAAQNKDTTGKARNRRMFGLLLGTLQRFRDDEKLKVEKEEKRKAVEQKVEERAKQDKENLRRERQNLFNKRKAEQAHMRAIQHKMELVEIHEEWEVQTKQLMKFIRTKTTPHIFYLPKITSTATDNKLKETHDALQDIITERRKQLEEEIDEVTCHGADAMETGDTNHATGDSVVKTVDTRQGGQEGASVGGHEDGVDQVEKDSDNEETRSSSDEGESQGGGAQGDGPHGKWENSNGDSVGGEKKAHVDEHAGKQSNEQESSSDSESGEDKKHTTRDEPSKSRDSSDKEKEESYRDKEDRDREEGHKDKEEGHVDKEGEQEDRHEDKEEKNRDKEDKHRDKEERHKHKEDMHRDKEVKHRDKEDRRRDKEDRRKDKEDRHRDKEDRHRDKGDRHRDKEDRHRDKGGSHHHHSHRSSRDSRKAKEQSPHSKKRVHSEDGDDSNEARDRRRRGSESLSDKTKAPKPDSRGTGEVSDDDDVVTKKGSDGDLVKAGDEDVGKGEGRTAASKEEAMED